MKGTRLVLGAALAAAAAVVVVGLLLPLEGWVKVIAYVAVGVAESCSISLAASLAATMFVKTGDEMWDTGYFRYMRAIWGKHWGGKGDLLQINVCRANWLGVITLILWFVAVAFLAIPILFNVLAITHGIQGMFRRLDNFEDNLFILIFISLITPFFSFVLFSFLFPGVNEIDSRKGTNFVLSAIALYGVILVSTFIAVPIRSVGLVSFLVGAAWFFGVIAAIAAVAGIIIGSFQLAFRLSKNLRQKTVPGQLAEMQKAGFKQKICPIIIGKPKKS